MILPVTIVEEHFEISQFTKFRSFARSAAEKAGLPPEALERVELVVEELVLNVSSHGYNGEPGSLLMELSDDESGIRIRLIDQASEFDPTILEAPDSTLPLAERHPGGLGIVLVRSMSEGMSYRREAGRNILEISVKPRITG